MQVLLHSHFGAGTQATKVGVADASVVTNVPLNEGIPAHALIALHHLRAYAHGDAEAFRFSSVEASFIISGDEISAHLQAKNPDMEHLQFQVMPDSQVSVKGVLKGPGSHLFPFELRVRLSQAAHSRLRVEFISARLGKVTIPSLLCRISGAAIQPVAIAQPGWLGDAGALQLDSVRNEIHFATSSTK
jgi:hypothetical protein